VAVASLGRPSGDKSPPASEDEPEPEPGPEPAPSSSAADPDDRVRI
jgi:hypothetical protein